MRESLKDQHNPAFKNFEEKLDKLNEAQDYSGVLDYLLSLKAELTNLPITHKNTPITIQRVVLLILPLLKWLDENKQGEKAKLKKQVEEFCDLVDGSDYPLSIKVNA